MRQVLALNFVSLKKHSTKTASAMNTHELISTANSMVANHKGLLAMDESLPTANKRFAKWGYHRLRKCVGLIGSCWLQLLVLLSLSAEPFFSTKPFARKPKTEGPY
jgi:hypothetical protein